jgi:Uma2 family endonuclease
MVLNPQTKTLMTAEEYFALPETNQRQELIDGQLITYGDDGMSPAPKDIHEEITMVLVALLLQFVPARELRTAPTDVHIDGINVVHPDLFWVNSKSGQCVRHEDGYLHGAPDLVVEILSPATAKQDKSTKYDLYEKHGVREYWIVDVDMQLVEVYPRQNEKFFRHGVFGTGDSFVSPVLDGKTINSDAIFSD